ncbi:LuxR C-terminal-related transcriptional regulator [Micromonospora yasonensis]|uniref:helix-turn-helix transcriptional regulator n=1 Tax=Micromonospora yasonensis TaxID=1128667 RepID=UPI00222F49BB|nr:LuxR C-terminal-related transcriptional regulator [Micromonospora yasonensis]MCW3844948.1 LuxR C-terminal-related transcriptional regulator [Micromonospora yasonensis]
MPKLYPRDDADQLRSALLTLRRGTGLPVAFGGLVRPASRMTITELSGTTTAALRGLAIHAGAGLGGKALALGLPLRVNDYPLARTISHEYDGPVGAEGLRSVVAVPVVVRREVRAVLYGAVRQRLTLGDRLVAAAMDVARDLERRLTDTDAARAALTTLRAIPPEGEPAGPEWEQVRQAHAELRGLLRRIDDPELRDRLDAVADRLAGAVARPDRPPSAVALSPRETDVLACVALGCTNVDVAEQLGLRPETVKSYLRSAMRKLDAHTRLEVVVAARRAGLLP